ncbi:hypothetical protein [Streptomyces sp. NPDC057557]|uniref:hypothetical protein n=1 Tax=Streptomyces sp. NPDC057557 TaxID=3346167 RepID=UPI003678FEED
MKAYRVKGTTDDVTTCELCGKQELKGTVVLEALDADGNEEAVCYFGVSCAAKAAGWTQREVRAGIKTAADEERARQRAERDAMWAAEREFLATWYEEHYGTRDLHEAAKRAGVSAVKLSGEAIHAYRELQRAAEQATKVVEESAAPELEPLEVAAPLTSCPVLAEPGNIHFMTAHCVDCNAFRMAKMSPDTVESWYHYGNFSQDEYEAYMYAWATSAYRHSAGGWAEEPTEPKVLEIVAAIRRHAGLPAPTTLAA